MDKHLYIIFEAALSTIVILLFLGLWLIEFNILIVVLSLLGSIYFFGKIVLGVKLIIDTVCGPEETETIFMGNLGSAQLDFFRNVKFSTVYFDDAELNKNFLLFDDSCCEDIFPGDRVVLEYYKRSRIILRLYHGRL